MPSHGPNSTTLVFGLLGELGAESIHAKFTRLGLAHTAVTDKVQQLLCIVKEHLITITPQVVLLHKREKTINVVLTFGRGNMKIISAFGYVYDCNQQQQSIGVLCPVHII